MTRDELITKMAELSEKAAEGIRRTAERLVDSGGVDFSDEPANRYYVAKAILCAALRHEVSQWRPLGCGETLIERNLMHF